jgi:hypothetical protein
VGGISRIEQFNRSLDVLTPIGLSKESLKIPAQPCVEESRGAVGAELRVTAGH